MKRLAVGSMLALFAVTLGCASGGTGLSSRDLAAPDLASMQYESLYHMLEAHNRVRVSTPTGSDALLVRARGERSMSSGDIQGNPGRPAEGVPPMGEQGGGSGGGVAEEPPESETITAGSSRYAPALLYVDGSEESDPINWLRNASLDDVERLQILRPTEASSRFGGSGNVAAVAVILKGDG